MPDGDISTASRPTRRLILSCLALWVLLAIALPLGALTLNVARVAGFPLGFWVAAQGSLLGLSAVAFLFSRRARGIAAREGWQPSLVFTAEALGSIALIGASGAVAMIGYDGLPLALGYVAGLALMTILIAPRFVLYPVQSLGGFFAARFGDNASGRIAVLAFATASVLLLAADLRGGALALQGLVRIGYVEAVAVAGAGIALTLMARAMFGPRRFAGGAYLVILAGTLLVLMALCVLSDSLPLPHFAFGYAVQQAAENDQRLVVNKLADVASLKPLASPFLKLSMTNFVGLVLAVAFGLAAAPHLLGRHQSQAAVPPGGAVRRAALATALVALFALGAAPQAVYSRLSFEQTFLSGLPINALPTAYLEASNHGWLTICGTETEDATEIAAACAKRPGQKGLLRLQDVVYSGDAFILAAPRVAGLAADTTAIFYFAIALAALVGGQALLAGVLGTLTERETVGAAGAERIGTSAVIVCSALIVAAASLAMILPLDVADFAVDGLAIIASALFPAIVLALYWRRMSSAGAIAAMLSGFVLSLVYIVGSRFAPEGLFVLSGGLSDAGAAELRKLDLLQRAVEKAQTAEAALSAKSALAHHVASLANWFGLKPGAIVLLAIPLAVLFGVTVSYLSRRPDRPPH